MSLEIVVGPMFAGKSSYILSCLRRYEAIGWPVLSLTSRLDTRYETNAIHSHNHERTSAISTKNLWDVIHLPAFEEARFIVVEEAQFFDDLYLFVKYAVETRWKDVLIVGLDGDSERRSFGHICEIIPLCDKITKLTAMCKMCADGTPALFTFRKNIPIESENSPRIHIGTDEDYESLCRLHYLQRSP